MRRLLTLAAFVALAAWGAAYTSTGSGNWSAAATWGGGGVPGNGDTFTVAAGHTVTVDQNTTVGTSPASGNIVGTITTTGQLIVAGGVTFTLRGDMSFTRASGLDPVVTLQPGATWEFDASAAVDPPNTNYKYQGTNSYGYGRIDAICTAVARCAIRSNAGGGNGNIQRSPGGSGATIAAAYVDFLRLGTATSAAIEARYVAGPAGTRYSITDSTFTDCGMIESSSIRTYTFDHGRNVHTGSLNATTLSVNPDASYTPVVNITDNVFDGHLGNNATPPNWLLVTVTGNYFAKRIRIATLSGAWTTFAGNLIRQDAAYQDPSLSTENYHFADSDNSDMHLVTLTLSRDASVTNCVYEWAGAAADTPHPALTPAASPGALYTYTFSNNLVLPAMKTVAGASWSSGWGLAYYGGYTNQAVVSDHNTLFQTNNISLLLLATGAHDTASVTSFRSNLAVNVYATPPVKLNQVTASLDVCVTDAACDYNSEYSAHTYATDYEGTWTTAPGPPTGVGTHDLSVDPQLADATRNLVSFDQRYLGKAAGAIWATPTVYVVGDIVSDPQATVYAGQTLNYRCIADHTSAAADRPGTGANWRTYWEWASLYWIRQAVAAQTTYTDGAIACANCTVIQALIAWVRRGWTPQNLALYLKGHDGATPGAVEMDAPVTRGAWW